MSDSEQLRVCYESIVKHNPSNLEAIHYLAVWHLERQSFQQARRYFGHMATIRQDDCDVWTCLAISCAMAEEFDECSSALKRATALVTRNEENLRLKFCSSLLFEKKKEYPSAMAGYMHCLSDCTKFSSDYSEQLLSDDESIIEQAQALIALLKELKGETMLRIASLRKDMGAWEQSMHMCNSITAEGFNESIRANALCLKGLLHEIKSEFPASEVVYRSALQLVPGHSTALERLGRVYLRYRETIPAAVQCFFKSVETNPSNHVAWYLLGRCYMVPVVELLLISDKYYTLTYHYLNIGYCTVL